MTKEISCTDLGIHDCDWVARDETAGDVVEQVVKHVRSKHNIKLPDAETIMEGDLFDDFMGGTPDPGAATIVRRLREELNLEGTEGTAPKAGFTGARAKSP